MGSSDAHGEGVHGVRPDARDGLRARRTIGRRAFVALWAGAVATIALPACGSDPSGPAATVAMREYSYDPVDLSIPRDSKVLIVNEGTEVHNWIIKEAGVGTAALRPGTRFVLDLKGVKPGRYIVYCDQAGHAQLGQTGTVTISAA